MTTPLEISVVIPTHNRSAKLALTLDHLAVQSVAAGWEVIVVANNCSDDTVSAVRHRSSLFPVPLTVMEEPTPGAAAARNAGARQARGYDVLFLDDDILVERDCLDRLARQRVGNPAAWILGQGFALPEHRSTPFGAFREASMPSVPVDQPIIDVTWFASGIALIPTDALLELGGYEENFTQAALEDADLVIRAVRAGRRIIFDPGLTFRHNDWAGTSLRDYCHRERIYCATAPLLERRFGTDDHPWSALIAANRPPAWPRDSVTEIVRKRLKGIVGRTTAQTLLIGLVERLERLHAPPALLWPVYRTVIAGSMYAGYQEGHRRLAGTGHPVR